MRKYKKIYILGSGFSKAAAVKMPAMKQLSSMLKKEANRQKYGALIEYVDILRDRSNDCDELTSIESISSIILGKSFFYNTSESLYFEYLKNQLLNWLFESLNREAPFIDSDKKGFAADFVRQVSSDRDNNNSDNILVMTFNYDLLLERLISSDLNDDVCIDYIVKLNRYSEENITDPLTDCRKNFRYLKLHGSFNWFRSPGGLNYNLNNIYLVKDDDMERDLIHHNDIPVFIPMTSSKINYRQGSFYNALWNIAERYLDLCSEISFIGYGFPFTDLENLQFFLKYKEKIRDIVVFESNVNLKKRLEKIFDSSEIINSDALEYIKNINP
jgi:disulfide oxidoreductase YuzD